MKMLSALLLLLATGSALAGDDLTLTRTFDRMSPPGADIWLWNGVNQGFDSDGHNAYGNNTVACKSSSDSVTGACPTGRNTSTGTTPTPIKLRFTEKRSALTVDLTLQGYRVAYIKNDSHCANHMTAQFTLSNFANVTCAGVYRDTSDLYVYVPAAELAKLPVGGLWTAHLKLVSYWGGGPNSSTAWNADITLNVTDPSHVDIYFPEFGTASPRVDLDLHPHGSPNENPWAADTVSLDMCLYDGYNANSTQYDVLLHDEQKAHDGRSDGDFSIYRVGGDASQTRDRVDYHVRMYNPENDSMLDVVNNQQLTWTQVNQGRVRPVRLPAIPTPVLCSPTPLKLSVAKFSIADKNAGYYQGTLTVVFTPTTPTVD
ncbi:CfaE/CblD family pilus tip adhesin [Yokenella regensburgei]|uniref:CfaE/CblD family pilus tip adhesin n=1 Tax=Yokenella regensburgei TaxID=158877 RepID=UPI003EDB545C